MNRAATYLFSSIIYSFALLIAPLSAVAGSNTTSVKGCDPESPETASLHPNLSLIRKLDIQNLDASGDIIAENFIWHYFNPRLPELHGDYHGIEGFKEFFAKLGEISNGSFRQM